ncbi:hypothetical protein PC116_g16846 [Phytophthora cactorum]|uniref:Uncharacterized protein n=1 Tax=Phytophthora cactorum TaxID=29920 RepID=A0A8T1CL30_9STRA|nr:hypothetical protein Pcac1_g2956 [Phytophthora cactorum]KAG2925043.1 hypothetical protein PC117_g15243 [Phytophthora cactorum]KAG3177157.1 hypothetical protein C6341_g8605 [Phytophthora cactorum]KAG3200369.1 hypothetical protein PC128_g4629 [Phytophthora cactorum]KAG4050004.1 hypothetical protein PC123_g14750 [Phytophthora cactorum]
MLKRRQTSVNVVSTDSTGLQLDPSGERLRSETGFQGFGFETLKLLRLRAKAAKPLQLATSGSCSALRNSGSGSENSGCVSDSSALLPSGSASPLVFLLAVDVVSRLVFLLAFSAT